MRSEAPSVARFESVVSRGSRPDGRRFGQRRLVTFPPAFVRRALDRLDLLQQRFRVSAFVVAVIKRYGDDRGGMYAALITFYGLLSVFPLMLLFMTITSMVLGRNSPTTKDLVNSALEQFPVIGPHLSSNIRALSTGSWFAFVASALFLLWGALGITSALQMASHHLWRRPRAEEADLWRRSFRGLRLLGIIALAVILTSVVVGLSASGYLRHLSPLFEPAATILAVVINTAAYFLALRILSPVKVGWRTLAPGTVVGGIGWTALQNVGGYLLSHQLQRTTQIYGFFAIVLGLVFWLNLGAQLFLYATTINVVADEHAWPRGLFEPSDEVKAEAEAMPDAQPSAT